MYIKQNKEQNNQVRLSDPLPCSVMIRELMKCAGEFTRLKYILSTLKCTTLNQQA